MWSGAASSDWASGGDNGVLGAEPKGESRVDCLLAGMEGGVELGLGVEVWLGTGKTCEVAAGGERAVGADGPASSVVAAGEWEGLVGGVGIATLMGAASTTSILRKYSFLDQPAFSAVYLPLAGCNFLGDDFPNIKAVAHYDDVDQHQPSAIDCLVVGEEVFDGSVILVFKTSEQGIDARVCVGQTEYLIYAEFAQSSVDGGLQAVVFKSVVEEEPLFFPSVLGSHYGISCSSFCVSRLVGHDLGG
ncbi:hypothetical protein V6N11_046735 [Hibiscus sabdariffa]|uniref:Uncharacterized protein n=1 Tax=Hibiscus sabdariffa TaxID=183260 RepID=A0ABR2NGH5_9ROSI